MQYQSSQLMHNIFLLHNKTHFYAVKKAKTRIFSSPIIQNNKLVGAVTHVFLSDPTKGYAVYSDWMLEQLS